MFVNIEEYMESIRTALKSRDGLSDSGVDHLMSEARALISDGEDPEEVLHEVFGLEPDYMFDDEFMAIW